MKQVDTLMKPARTRAGKVVVRKRNIAVGSIKRPVAAGDSLRLITKTQITLGSVSVEVERVSVASARAEMAGLIRASAKSGRAFLIHNAKNASAVRALLINPAVLEQRLLAAVIPPRSLGELIETLPFKRRGSPRIVVSRPDDFAPARRVPGQLRAVRQVQSEGVPFKVVNEPND